jgi:hypothetical protein
MYEYSWQKTQMEDIHRGFLAYDFPVHDGGEAHHPKPIVLEQYPADFVASLLANEAAHPLITMAHIDKHGYPFISVMGFSFNDGKINVTSRGGAWKQRRLENDPRCCFTYQNMLPRPDKLACLTLLGKARVTQDPALIRRANEALMRKNYRDTDPDNERMAPAFEAMNRAERELIILDEVEAMYMISPMRPGTGSGIPTPVISWRADRTTRRG